MLKKIEFFWPDILCIMNSAMHPMRASVHQIVCALRVYNNYLETLKIRLIESPEKYETIRRYVSAFCDEPLIRHHNKMAIDCASGKNSTIPETYIPWCDCVANALENAQKIMPYIIVDVSKNSFDNVQTPRALAMFIRASNNLILKAMKLRFRAE